MRNLGALPSIFVPAPDQRSARDGDGLRERGPGGYDGGRQAAPPARQPRNHRNAGRKHRCVRRDLRNRSAAFAPSTSRLAWSIPERSSARRLGDDAATNEHPALYGGSRTWALHPAPRAQSGRREYLAADTPLRPVGRQLPGNGGRRFRRRLHDASLANRLALPTAGLANTGLDATQRGLPTRAAHRCKLRSYLLDAGPEPLDRSGRRTQSYTN